MVLLNLQPMVKNLKEMEISLNFLLPMECNPCEGEDKWIVIQVLNEDQWLSFRNWLVHL